MGDTNPDNRDTFEISEEQWAAAVAELDKQSAAKQIYVGIWWLFGFLRANAFRFQVYERTLQILLQPQSPRGPADGRIEIFLPKPFEGEYERHTSESGDIVLTMKYPVGKPPNVLDWSVVQLATNWEFLELVNSRDSPKTN
jgi:hypothetical protein